MLYIFLILSFWMVIYLVLLFDQDMNFEVRRFDLFLWNCILMIVYLLVDRKCDNNIISIMFVLYITLQAYVDLKSMQVYTVPSVIICIYFIFILFSIRGSHLIFSIFLFWLYIKALELFGAYESGDTDYLFIIYLFQLYINENNASYNSVLIIIFANILHCFLNRNKKNLLIAFTPYILAGTVLMLML